MYVQILAKCLTLFHTAVCLPDCKLAVFVDDTSTVTVTATATASGPNDKSWILRRRWSSPSEPIMVAPMQRPSRSYAMSRRRGPPQKRNSAAKPSILQTGCPPVTH